MEAPGAELDALACSDFCWSKPALQVRELLALSWMGEAARALGLIPGSTVFWGQAACPVTSQG